MLKGAEQSIKIMALIGMLASHDRQSRILSDRS
ncbi:hypothetical protein CF161_23321 [Pseudomonas sp. CF161]|nr:hypothetical protein CF161_23321 [Pseudomonas sp. CF161]